MHGTYRMHVEGIAGGRTASLRRGAWRAALRMSSCLVLGAGLVLVPRNPFPAEPRMAQQVVLLPSVKPAETAATLVPAAVRVEKPAPATALAVAQSTDKRASRTSPLALLVVTPTATKPVFIEPPAVRSAEVAALRPRKVDIAQIAEPETRSLHVPQLRERGMVAGSGATLAAKVAAMQVPLPPPLQLSDPERAALLAEASSELTVRLGEEAIGQVAFRTGDTGSIDVQLAGLLDLVADRMAPEEYTRLRGAAAADSYVSLDELRAIGLSLRYDPVYDELDLSA